MRGIMAIVALVATAVLLLVAGCTGTGLKWSPSEQQKQAADLTVRDVSALKGKVFLGAEPIRAEAQRAAEVTQTYMGLPAQRPATIDEANPALLDAAASDAAKPPPTPAQVGDAVITKIERVAQTGFGLAELVLTGLTGVAGAWGLVKVKNKVGGWRDQARTSQLSAAETLAALREVAAGIDQLPAGVKAQVKAIQRQHQSDATEKLVATVRKSDVGDSRASDAPGPH